MNPAYLLALVTSVVFGTADFMGGFATRRAPAITVTFVSGAAGLVTLSLAALFVHGAPVPADFAWSAVAGLCGGLGIALLYRAFAAGPVSVAAPVISLSMLAVPVVFGLAWGERPTLLAVIGVLLAIVAFPLLSESGGANRAPAVDRRMLRDALGSGVLLGGFLVLIRRVSPGAGLMPLIVARLTIVVVFGALVVVARQPAWPVPGARRVTIAAGLLDSFANICYFASVHRGALAAVGTIVSLSPATTLLLARLVLGERWSVRQRYGLGVAAAAIICVSLG